MPTQPWRSFSFFPFHPLIHQIKVRHKEKRRLDQVSKINSRTSRCMIASQHHREGVFVREINNVIRSQQIRGRSSSSHMKNEQNTDSSQRKQTPSDGFTSSEQQRQDVREEHNTTNNNNNNANSSFLKKEPIASDLMEHEVRCCSDMEV